jgi:HSP90 family molecular chaperone
MTMCRLQADEEADKEEEAPTTKKVTVTEHDWEQLNTQNAIWLRSPSDVTAEEYEKFYKAISKVSDSAHCGPPSAHCGPPAHNCSVLPRLHAAPCAS